MTIQSIYILFVKKIKSHGSKYSVPPTTHSVTKMHKINYKLLNDFHHRFSTLLVINTHTLYRTPNMKLSPLLSQLVIFAYMSGHLS